MNLFLHLMNIHSLIVYPLYLLQNEILIDYTLFVVDRLQKGLTVYCQSDGIRVLNDTNRLYLVCCGEIAQFPLVQCKTFKT